MPRVKTAERVSAAGRALAVQSGGDGISWAGHGLMLVTAVLVGAGVLSVYSASSFIAQAEGLPDAHYAIDQVGHVAVGALALVAASFVDYRLYRWLATPLIVASAVLLLVLILPGTESIAPRINGARRWLQLGVTFQPSEIAKIAVVLWTADAAVRKQDRMNGFVYGLLPFLLVDGLICALILLEPHFSAALMVAAVTGVILFCAGGRIGHFVALGLASLPILWDQIVNTGYRMNRVVAFLNPEVGASDVGYQLRQSLIAVGSGGVFGVGYGESSQKLYYLPEPQNDFIFSIIAEEWGWLGAVTLIGLFLGWFWLGVRIARGAPDLFGRLLAIGITALVGIAAFGHFGVTLGVLPTTGVNLPFVSAGGTSMVLTLGATGVLLNIAKQRE